MGFQFPMPLLSLLSFEATSSPGAEFLFAFLNSFSIRSDPVKDHLIYRRSFSFHLESNTDPAVSSESPIGSVEPVYLLPDLNSTTQLSILPVFKLSPQVIWGLYMESKLHPFHLLEADMISLPTLLLLFLQGPWGSQSSKEQNWIIFPVIQVQTWGHWEGNGRALCDGNRPEPSPSWAPVLGEECLSLLQGVSLSSTLQKWLEVTWLGLQLRQVIPVLLPHQWKWDNNATLPFRKGQREFSLISEK